MYLFMKVSFSPDVIPCAWVPAGSPPGGGNVMGYVLCTLHCPDINQPSLPTPLYSVLVSISVFMALSTVFHSINSLDNSPFSHSVLVVLALPYWSFQLYLYLFKKVSCSPAIIPSGWLGSKHQSALLTCSFGWQVVCDWKLNLLYNSSSYRSSMNPVVRACAYLTGVLGQWVSVRVFSIYQRQNCNQL